MSSLKKIVDRTTAAAKKKANDAMSMQKTRCVDNPNQHCKDCLMFSGRIFPAGGTCPGVQATGNREQATGTATAKRQGTGNRQQGTGTATTKTQRPKTSALRPACFVSMQGRMEFPYRVDLAGKLTPITGQEEFWDFHLYKGCWTRTGRQRTEYRGQKSAAASPLTSRREPLGRTANLSPAVKGVAA